METDLKKTAGQRLQLLRIKNNMTQEQMSERLSLSTSAYCKIEYGETDLTLTRLSKIAEVLCMPMTELILRIVDDSSSDPLKRHPSAPAGCGDPATDDTDDLRQLVKANSKLIDMLCKRIEILENKHNAVQHSTMQK